MKPKVSIIVPLYNVEKYLQRCLDSIVSQTFINFECILINDCSTDNSPSICKRYVSKDKRIKLFNNKKNIGSSFARKRGLEVSRGNYILFIDSDDYVENKMLETLYSKALSEDYDMVYCDYYEHTRSGNIKYKTPTALSDNQVDNIKSSTLSMKSCHVVWNKLVKKELYDKVLFPKYNYAEDLYITMQILFFSKKNGYVRMPLYHYVYNQNSLCNKYKNSYSNYVDLQSIFKEIYVFLKEKYGNDLNVFEPQLSRAYRKVLESNPKYFRHKIKRILQVIIPFKSWRMFLKKLYIKIKSKTEQEIILPQK